MKLDRAKLSIMDLHAKSPDKGYWRRRTAIERLRAVQMDRQVAYGRANTTRRLQRILEVAERR
jgi:hypothetical protein